MSVAGALVILGPMLVLFGITITLIVTFYFKLDDKISKLDDKLDDKISKLDSKVESLERSIHADFIEHLRREHSLGES